MDLFVRTWVYMLTTADQIGERVRRDERGQAAVEYILVLAFVALLVIALITGGVLTAAKAKVTEALQMFTTTPT